MFDIFYRGCASQLIKADRCGSLKAWRNMTIGIQCYLDASVSYTLVNYFGVNPYFQHQGSMAMPSIMQTDTC